MTKVEELKEDIVRGMCSYEEENKKDAIEYVNDLIEAVREEKEADINNKLTPLINIVAMLNDGLEDGTISIAGQAQKVDIIKSEIDRANNFNQTS